MEQNTANIVIILLLSFLLVISVLGINILQNVVNVIAYVVQVLWDLFKYFFGNLSYTTGEVVNGTTDVVVDTSIFGIEIVDGMLHNIGNMFKGQATPMVVHDIDKHIQSPSMGIAKKEEPQPAGTTKDQWCLAGVDNNENNKCVKLNQNQKCNSGKMFNSLIDCNGNKLK